MRWVAIPFELYKELFTNIKIGKNNTVTGVLQSDTSDKQVVKGRVFEEKSKQSKR